MSAMTQAVQLECGEGKMRFKASPTGRGKVVELGVVNDEIQVGANLRQRFLPRIDLPNGGVRTGRS
jgi:hypothetical protein